MKQIYIAMCYNNDTKESFVDEVFTNKKECEKYIEIQKNYWTATDKNYLFYQVTRIPRTKALFYYNMEAE